MKTLPDMCKCIVMIFFLALGAATVSAEDAPVVFFSANTNLSGECTWAYPAAELSEGQDNALVCRGCGSYQHFKVESAPFYNVYFHVVLRSQPGICGLCLLRGLPRPGVHKIKDYPARHM